VALTVHNPPTAKRREGWKLKSGMEMSVPLTMASAAAKHLTMLSAYLVSVGRAVLEW
tara:strand:- start:46 stop:216 length:171 start_codon:yes stop_codon:yes gene_type:complete